MKASESFLNAMKDSKFLNICQELFSDCTDFSYLYTIRYLTVLLAAFKYICPSVCFVFFYTEPKLDIIYYPLLPWLGECMHTEWQKTNNTVSMMWFIIKSFMTSLHKKLSSLGIEHTKALLKSITFCCRTANIRFFWNEIMYLKFQGCLKSWWP